MEDKVNEHILDSNSDYFRDGGHIAMFIWIWRYIYVKATIAAKEDNNISNNNNKKRQKQ